MNIIKSVLFYKTIIHNYMYKSCITCYWNKEQLVHCKLLVSEHLSENHYFHYILFLC